MSHLTAGVLSRRFTNSTKAANPDSRRMRKSKCAREYQKSEYYDVMVCVWSTWEKNKVYPNTARIVSGELFYIGEIFCR